MSKHELSLAALLVLTFSGCTAESTDDDLDPVLDGKTDSITGRVSIEGGIGFGDRVASTFDGTRYHGYTFRAAAGARIDVALSGDAADKTDTVVRIYGPRSGGSWGGYPIAKDDDGGTDRSSHLGELELTAGGEYLIVASCKNRQFDGRTYALSLACTNDHCAPETASGKGTIRVEVDYVGYQRFEPGTTALVQSYFASIGYDLAFVEGDELPPVDILEFGANNPMLRGYYLDHFEHRGQPGWHYMLMGDTVSYSNRGWGMLGGDIFLISSDPVSLNPEHRTEAQANIIMHELGHNLGLLHEGFEPELGSHNKSTCATADQAPAPDVPVTIYSPTCIDHIRLDSMPYVP